MNALFSASVVGGHKVRTLQRGWALHVDGRNLLPSAADAPGEKGAPATNRPPFRRISSVAFSWRA